MISRRKFLGNSLLSSGLIGLNLPFLQGNTVEESIKPLKKKDRLKYGIADWTFHKLGISQSIEIMNQLDVKALSLKSVHLPLDSSDEFIKKVVNTYTSGGVDIYAVGVINMSSKDEVDNAFEYADKVGGAMIIGSPRHDLLDYVESRVVSTGIKLAIHNHGPKSRLYKTAADVFEKIKNLDSRIGLCMDIGHSERAGENSVEAVVKFKDRLFDLHIKDITVADLEGKDIEIGRGVIEIPSLVKTLYKIGYNGFCSAEFEKDTDNPIPGLSESLGYFKGVEDAFRVFNKI